MNKPQNAWVFRQSPGAEIFESFCLANEVIVCGWSEHRESLELQQIGLLRDFIKKIYYQEDAAMKRAGYAASTILRFRDQISIGDWVIVPASGSFYVAVVTGETYWDSGVHASDGEYRLQRKVQWLNDKKPISKTLATGPLISRMKIFQTSAAAGDLVDDLWRAVELAATGTTKEQVHAQFRKELAEQITKQLRAGTNANDDRLERIVAALFRKLGARDVRVRGGQSDVGADVVGYLDIGQMLPLRFGAQVKWHSGKTDAWAVEQILQAWEEEELQIGFVVSTGEFSDQAKALAEEARQKTGRIIALVEGQELADQILDVGIGVLA